MPKTKTVISVTFWLTATLFGGLCVSFAGLYLYLAPKLPAVESLKETKFQIPLRVFTQDGELIGEFGEKRRSPVTYSEIPQNYVDAILSAEDDRFYSHSGVDLKGLLRAVSQILKTGEIQSGGSTITMQVARNFFLSREQVFTRKFNEILLALQIERELTKEEILTLYVNKIYLGNRAYGIQAAAQVYYGKNIDELSLAQIAMIAGLPKAPSAYNPLANPARALIRRDWILSRMRDLGYITDSQYQTAVDEPISAKNYGSVVTIDAPYVAEMARAEMIDRYGLAAYTDGYKAYVTIDGNLQTTAQKVVIEGLEEYDLRHGYRGPEAQLPVIALAEISEQKIPSQQIEESVPLDATATDQPLQSEQSLLDDNHNGDADANLAEASADPEPTAAQESADQANTNEKNRLFTSAQFDRELWLAELKSTPVYADRIPAAVTSVSADAVELLTANDELLLLEKDQGFESVRPYINENRRGSTYKTLDEFLKPGDVIRLKPKADTWVLSQIPAVQGALVALDPQNGAIRALVGGYDFRQSHFNRATQAARQPGSNFKPFIYGVALEEGFTPASIINDAPIVFDDDSLESTWRPENSSGKFYGPTRLREALYNSRNLVSIRLLRSIGISTAIEKLNQFGFDSAEMPRDLSLALGSHALTPLQVATGYTILANGGYRVTPHLLDRVVWEDDQVVFQARPETVCDENCQQAQELTSLEQQMQQELALLNQQATEDDSPATENTLVDTLHPLPQAPRVMDERVNFLINSMLRDVITRGTGRKARVLERQDLAGKTGTTNGPTDAWFSGYNSHLVATTWVGFDQNQLLGRREFGGSAALPIWIDFMAEALAGVPEDQFLQPNGIVSVKIDPENGERAAPGDPDAIFEVFREEFAPERNDEQTDSSQVAESIEGELF